VEITVKILKVKVLFIFITYNCACCIYNLHKINNSNKYWYSEGRVCFALQRQTDAHKVTDYIDYFVR